MLSQAVIDKIQQEKGEYGAKFNVTNDVNWGTYSQIKNILKDDPVNHPGHYTKHPSGVECITITQHMNFNLGNVIKYVWRADLKNGNEDLKKARFYIDQEITLREQQSNS